MASYRQREEVEAWFIVQSSKKHSLNLLKDSKKNSAYEKKQKERINERMLNNKGASMISSV